MKLNIGGITEAGKSKKNKTGSWRYFFPFVDKEKCNGCGICEMYCPDSCISIEDDIAVISEVYCKGCGICAYECRRKAVNMKLESEAVV